MKTNGAINWFVEMNWGDDDCSMRVSGTWNDLRLVIDDPNTGVCFHDHAYSTLEEARKFAEQWLLERGQVQPEARKE